MSVIGKKYAGGVAEQKKKTKTGQAKYRPIEGIKSTLGRTGGNPGASGAPWTATRHGDTLRSVNSTAGRPPATDAQRAGVLNGTQSDNRTGVNAAAVTDGVARSMASSANAVSDGGGIGGVGGNPARTGFGQSVDPNAFGEAWANPEAVIRKWFNYKGMPTNTGYEAMVQELQPSLGIDFMIANDLTGKGDSPAASDTAHYLDFVDRTLREGSKAGGDYLTPGEVMKALLNPQGTALQNHLTADSLKPSDQVTNMLSAMRYGLSPSLPTPFLNAFLNAADSAGKDYQAQMLTNGGGQQKPFPQVLRELGIM